MYALSCVFVMGDFFDCVPKTFELVSRKRNKGSLQNLNPSSATMK